MAFIPAGSFQMGSNVGDNDEQPVHTVYLDAFYMDVYEVTNTRYAECEATGECHKPWQFGSSSNRPNAYYDPNFADYPVVHVDWYMAQNYCEWRGARLPTEAEWEKAARSGLVDMLYPWGNEASCSFANYWPINAACVGDTSEVGGFPPNGFGLYDMVGNVEEWVADWYNEDYYSISPVENPTGPIYGSHRVLRGGSWIFNEDVMRVSHRHAAAPEGDPYDYGFGFRCARLAGTPTPTPISLTPTPSPVPDFIDPFNFPMEYIPAGSFQMGSDVGADDERPVHTVFLDAFYMDRYEVTNARYIYCVTSGTCSQPSYVSGNSDRDPYYGNPEYSNYPVTWIDWTQANTYCEWRGSRLPTEAEWERAARGGLDGMLYSWGNEIDCSLANYSLEIGACTGDSTEVGSYPPNGFGLYDMVGNVEEWVADWYDANYYFISPAENPTGPGSTGLHVLRGGHWLNTDWYVRTSIRAHSIPEKSDYLIGFRCARTP